MAHGRTVLGVIRGVGLSNDGRSRGLMVPSEEGQVRAFRAAYAESGLSPADISLVECHATGTMLGDGAEVRSMRQVFTGARGLPLGSLKSNLGHLITASGAAAAIKVLGALRDQVRPPTRHAEAPLGELDDGMFRLLPQEEPWPAPPDGAPRRAAISNFGFGGNNAHLILEEWTGRLPPGPSAASLDAGPPPPAIAIVAQAVRTGAGAGATFFAQAVLEAPPGPHDVGAQVPARHVELEGAGLRFPPNDLRAALAQQTMLLSLAQELSAVLEKLPRERTTLLVGMQCDAEVARHALRWRAAPHWLGVLPPAIASAGLTAASVVGCMPNIVANRLSHQLDFQGPGFAVCAEELSGVVALELAARALRQGEVDAAVIGAVDLCCEPVAAAAAAVLPANRRNTGDGAVLLVLKRHADALRDGDEVLALLPAAPADGAPAFALNLTPDDAGLTPRFGHAHAASGLLHVAAAVVACAHHAIPSAAGAVPWLPSAARRDARVHVTTSTGQSATVHLQAPERAPLSPLRALPFLGVYAADTIAGLAAALASGQEAGDAIAASCRFRIAVTGDNAAQREDRVRQAFALLQGTTEPTTRTLAEGIHLGCGPAQGELAFVFTGAAGAYADMGRDLALAFPGGVDGLAARAHSLRDAAGWVYAGDAGATAAATPSDKLWGASYLAQLHTEVTRGLLGLRPTAAIGYCSGETNSLFALGAWNDLDGFRDAVAGSQVYEKWLCGEFACLRAAWELPAGEAAEWSTWRFRAPSGGRSRGPRRSPARTW